MTQTITRLYATAADAEAAVKDLKARSFGDNEIFVVGPPANAEASVDNVAATIAQGGLLKSDAAIYAQGVVKGGTLVTVHAPFGSGAKATGLLDRHNPIPSGIAPPSYPRIKWDDAAPFSSTLQYPVLLKDPTPFASFWRLPSLTDHDYSLSRKLGWSFLSSSPSPLSDKLGWSLLSDNPAPLSSKLGLTLLR